jgi:hypothetical protein
MPSTSPREKDELLVMHEGGGSHGAFETDEERSTGTTTSLRASSSSSFTNRARTVLGLALAGVAALALSRPEVLSRLGWASGRNAAGSTAEPSLDNLGVSGALRSFAALGAGRDECPEAYIAPPAENQAAEASLGAAPGEELLPGFLKFSYHARRIAQLADHIYIICQHCRLNIPPSWRGKTTFVHGKTLDKCIDVSYKDHWHRASYTHAHALVDALNSYHDTVAIIEEDIHTRDVANGRAGLNVLYNHMNNLKETMEKHPDWNILRVGYRPYMFEGKPDCYSKITQQGVCPDVCRCERVNAFTCIMNHAGCDVRSSDFYLIRKPAMHKLIEGIQKDMTVDCQAMSAIDKQIFVIPQLSFQRNLDINIRKQLDHAEQFSAMCAGGVPTLGDPFNKQAFAAAAARGETIHDDDDVNNSHLRQN